MEVKIFGRIDCPRCAEAHRKLNRFFTERHLENVIDVRFYDIETAEGLAEGMWHEIGTRIPVVIIHGDAADPYSIGPAFAQLFDIGGGPRAN